jgi:hypothetical protein
MAGKSEFDDAGEAYPRGMARRHGSRGGSHPSPQPTESDADEAMAAEVTYIPRRRKDSSEPYPRSLQIWEETQ